MPAVRSVRPRRYLQVGPGARIGRNVTFSRADVTCGARVRIFRYGEFVGPIRVGDDVFFNRNAYVRPMTTIGSRVDVGPFVRIITDTHVLGSHERRAGEPVFEPVTIGDGVWIGADATILPGVTIGDGAVIAAGAVVHADVPADTLVAGVPATIRRKLP